MVQSQNKTEVSYNYSGVIFMNRKNVFQFFLIVTWMVSNNVSERLCT